PRTPARTYSASGDLGPQLLVKFNPRLADTLYAAYRAAPVTGVSPSALCTVSALRVKTGPFGHNAPKEIILDDGEIVDRREWALAEFSSFESGSGLASHVPAAATATATELRTLSLDAVHEGIT